MGIFLRAERSLSTEGKAEVYILILMRGAFSGEKKIRALN